MLVAGSKSPLFNIHSGSGGWGLLLFLGHYVTLGWCVLATVLAVWGALRGKQLPGPVDLALALLAATLAMAASYKIWWAWTW